jgi:flagella basal body P-ring formation protein FlgA
MDRPRLFPACLLLAATAVAGAQAVQPLQPIRDVALAALQADASAQAMVAPGLRLPACHQPLTASASGPTVADVRCPDSPGWRLFVPLRLGAEARSPQAAEENRDLAVMVKRGDPVVLRASIGGTEVRMGGRALGQARVGGILNVENDSSHRIIRGRLAADGSVEVVN